MEIIRLGKKLGAVAVGVTTAETLNKWKALNLDILPSARSIVVIACGHSRAALDSRNLQIKQNDTIATYEKARNISKELAMALEKEGHGAVAIPGFIPIDMTDAKQGMVGAVDLRKAAVEAGIGSYGKSGLVLVKGYGPRVRLGAVLTTASLKPTKRKSQFPCPTDCQVCILGCPSKALLGGGDVDKRACGRMVFQFGLRGMTKFVGGMLNASPERRTEMLNSHTFRELWQTLVSGNYYYCFACQSLCPMGKGNN
ncbi:MAG: epoxyqueuosine reductase [Deltaproteobacteria bacterium]|nr:epoxyqueuosine reductase [Deltaproteobacteria bacterium]